jgi:hypothetical protein
MDMIWHPELQTANAMFEPSRVGHARLSLTELGGWSLVDAGYEDWDLWFRSASRGYDFAMAADRTVILSVSPGSRRNGLRPPHAVVLERLDTMTDANRVLADLARAEHRSAARDIFREETCRWYSALADADRFRVAEGLDGRLVMSGVRDYLTSNRKPSLLEGLASAPLGDGAAIVLPLWCASGRHAQAIGQLVRGRFAGQLDYVRALVESG